MGKFIAVEMRYDFAFQYASIPTFRMASPMNKLIRNHIILWRKESGDILETCSLTLYEDSVRESMHL